MTLQITVLGPGGYPRPPWGNFNRGGGIVPTFSGGVVPPRFLSGVGTITSGSALIYWDLGYLMLSLPSNTLAAVNTTIQVWPGFPFNDPDPSGRLNGSTQIVASKITTHAAQGAQQYLQGLVEGTVYMITLQARDSLGFTWLLDYCLICGVVS